MTRAEQIAAIRDLPQQLAELVSGYTAEQLTTPYNAPEWTIAQNVHHLADSHLNSFNRMKIMLTETNPTLRPYDQNAYAELPDSNHADIGTSLTLLQGLHARWVILLENITDWDISAHHPETGTVTLGSLLAYYAEHGRGHLKQIQDVIDRMP